MQNVENTYNKKLLLHFEFVVPILLQMIFVLAGGIEPHPYYELPVLPVINEGLMKD